MDNSVSGNNSYNQRDERLLKRRNIIVDLSNRPTNDSKPYHCWDCGYIIATIHNQPHVVAEVKITTEDLGNRKMVGNLCRKCNIMYFFV